MKQYESIEEARKNASKYHVQQEVTITLKDIDFLLTGGVIAFTTVDDEIFLLLEEREWEEMRDDPPKSEHY